MYFSLYWYCKDDESRRTILIYSDRNGLWIFVEGFFFRSYYVIEQYQVLTISIFFPSSVFHCCFGRHDSLLSFWDETQHSWRWGNFPGDHVLYASDNCLQWILWALYDYCKASGKQRDLLFYPSWAYSLPTWLLKIPISFVGVFLWVAVTYYGIGYDLNVQRWDWLD